MAIKQLNHITLIVNDKDQSSRFYEEAFCLKRTDRLTEKICPYGGIWYDLTPEVQLHVWQRDHKTEKTEQHFALIVDDYDALTARIESFGGKVEPTKLLPGCRKRAYTYDPDGNRIEVMELLQ